MIARGRLGALLNPGSSTASAHYKCHIRHKRFDPYTDTRLLLEGGGAVAFHLCDSRPAGRFWPSCMAAFTICWC